MKIVNRLKSFFISGVAASLVAVGMLSGVVGHSAAATGRIYFSPSSASVVKNSNVTLTVRVTPGATINGITATVTYDTSKLKFVSSNAGVSAFDASYGSVGTSSPLHINRIKNGGTLNKDSAVLGLTFKALSSSGSTSLSVSGRLTNAGSYVSPDPSGGTATVKFSSGNSGGSSGGESSSGGTSGGSTSGGSSSGSNSNSGSGSSKPKAGPVAVTSTAGKVEFNKVSVSLSAAKPFIAYIEYGVDNQFNYSTTPTKKAKAQTVSLNTKLLLPGTTYQYRVVSVGDNGKKLVSDTQTFRTKGFSITVRLFDKNNSPITGQQVTLHSTAVTGKTDSHGMVQFSDVAPNLHELTIDKGGKTYSQTLFVDGSKIVTSKDGTQSALVQNLAVVYPDLQVGSGASVVKTMIFIGLVLLVFLALVGWRVLGKKGIALPGPHMPHHQAEQAKTAPVVPTAHESARPGSVVGPTSNDPGRHDG